MGVYMNEERNLRALLDRLPDIIKKEFDENGLSVKSLLSIKGIIDNFKSNFKDYSDNLNKGSDLFVFIKEKLSELQRDIDNQPSEENDMIPETNALAIGAKIAIAGGTLLVIGIALAWIIYDKRNKKTPEETANNKKQATYENTDNSSTGKGFLGSIKSVGKDIRGNNPPPIDYQPHHLLLIIPANQSDGYKMGQQINNEQVNKLIANSVRAYCFAGEKDATNEIAVGVKSDDDEKTIDNTTESRVFVHLLLSAEPSIIDERIRLNISDKIEPNTTIEIVKIAKLQTARSTTAFYEI